MIQSANPTNRPEANAVRYLSGIVDEITDRLNRGETPDLAEYAPDDSQFRQALEQIVDTLSLLREPSVNPPGIEDVPGLTGHLGDFRLIRELGRGGMGVVYEAEQISLGRRVALKVLPFAAVLDKQQLTRFKNEARAAATLDHPNVVAIYSVGTERGVHYYAMQLIEGQSLAEVIAAMKPSCAKAVQETPSTGALLNERASADTAKTELLTTNIQSSAALSSLPSYESNEFFRAIAKLGIQAAEALDHAHQNGILHRDIKPGNLLVDDAGKLWVTDFGLARIEQDAGMTMTGDILGTLRYMSPEQALAKRVVVDHRSDLYSLGVTLYELLTLQPVFQSDDRQELLRRIAFEDPHKPRSINGRIPPDLETVLLKSIEKNPADRYATAQQLADDLRRFVDGQPIQARPANALQRLAKWSRRHSAIVLATAVVLGVTTILSVGSSLLISRAHHRESVERQNAENSERLATANASRAKAIAEFLVGAFESPNPSRGGHSITVAEVLTQAEQRLAVELQDQPLVRASLLNAIGKSRLSLGLIDDAVEPLREAYAVRTAELGPTHSDVFESRTLLAKTYTYRDPSEKTRLLESAVEQQRQGSDSYSPEMLSVMQDLAMHYGYSGRLSDAVALFRQIVDQRRKLLGAEHVDTITADILLSFAKTGVIEPWAAYGTDQAYRDWVGGHFDREVEIIPALERAVSATKRAYGSNDPRTLAVMHLMGVAYSRIGHLDEAVELHKQCLENCHDKLGDNHPDADRYMWFLVNAKRARVLAYRRAGQLEEAKRYTAAAIADSLAEGRYTLAVGLVRGGSADEMDVIVNSAIDDDHRRLPSGLDMLVVGELRLAAGKHDAALAAIQAAVAVFRPDYVYKSLGLTLLALGRAEEAKIAFQRALRPQRGDDEILDMRTAPQVDEWQSPEQRARVNSDQLTAAHFLNLITQQQYVDEFSNKRVTACLPWYYIGLRREIEGDPEAAVLAYMHCVELGNDETAHSCRTIARWRLSKLAPESHQGY